jgi:hypothetical protein
LEDHIVIRSYRQEDRNFILATWLHSLRPDNPDFKKVRKFLFYNIYEPTIKKILENPKTDIKIACLYSDPNTILAYCVHQSNIIHYVYTKLAWRKLGIVKRMVPSSANTASHITKLARKIIPKEIKYIPYEQLEKQL